MKIPAEVSYSLADSYENQVRSEKKLIVVVPPALLIIFMLIYFQFSDVPVTMLVFTGIFVAWSGRFLMMYSIKTYNLAVAVWVGFWALFGVATDDGVAIIIVAGSKCIRPALMTVATTLLALIPVLTSSGKGSDVMVPMAIPSFGGMRVAIITA